MENKSLKYRVKIMQRFLYKDILKVFCPMMETKEYLENYYIHIDRAFYIGNDLKKFTIIKGIPFVKYSFGIKFNPLIVGLFSLLYFQRKDFDKFMHLVNVLVKNAKLRTIDDINVAFWYYNFPFPPRAFSPGWISGMAQGVIASALIRAYKLTKKR
jgi:hypothetical protein